MESLSAKPTEILLFNKNKKRLFIIGGISIAALIAIIVTIVVVTKKNNSSPTPTPTPTPKTPWERYLYSKKYLYVWEYYSYQFLLDMIKDHNFTRVYLSIGCIEKHWDDYFQNGKLPDKKYGDISYEEIIKKINDLGVEVELVTYLGSDPDDFTEMERAVKVANIVKTLSKKVKIKALHFDQESGGDQYAFENLLTMYKKVKAVFPVSSIIRPYWLKYKMSELKSYFTNKTFYNEFSDCETLTDAVLKVSDFGDLMAYNQNYTIVESYMEKFYNLGKTHNIETKSIIEIGWGDGVPEDDTLHEKYVADKSTFFNFVADMAEKYDGITIHYFERWYETLYCVWPGTGGKKYQNGEPLECKYNNL